MDKNIQISTFSRFTQVSRETIDSLIKYEEILIKTNKTLNLIGNSTISTMASTLGRDKNQAARPARIGESISNETTQGFVNVNSGTEIESIQSQAHNCVVQIRQFIRHHRG